VDDTSSTATDDIVSGCTTDGNLLILLSGFASGEKDRCKRSCESSAHPTDYAVCGEGESVARDSAPKPRRNVDNSSRVKEKRLRTRRIFVLASALIVLLLVSVIVVVIFGLRGAVSCDAGVAEQATQSEPSPSPSSANSTGNLFQKHTFMDVSLYLRNVSLLTETQVNAILTISKTWFEQSFNNQTYAIKGSGERSRSEFLRQVNLQKDSSIKNPSLIAGIHDLSTDFEFAGQIPNSTGVILYYNQNVLYRITPSTSSQEIPEPESLLLLPYLYRPTMKIYGSLLQSNVYGFENLTLPISVPDIPTQ